MKPKFLYYDKPLITPKEGVNWADTMVLNPGMILDPETNTIHMLFRATGPCSEKKMEGSKYDPYPIFLGYGCSHDKGNTWEFDFERPALAPELSYTEDGMYITNIKGEKVLNNSNGCVEDPRIFMVEGEYYLTVASRLFPPGPYWSKENFANPGCVYTNYPEWAKREDNPFGKAASTNDTVTVLYKINIKELAKKNYDEAFTFVCNLTAAEHCDNRDVFLFPNKMMIDGKMQYVMLHRPDKPQVFDKETPSVLPSMFIAAAECFEDFTSDKATHKLLAVPTFEWEDQRIGGSFPPLRLENGDWLVSYHGAQAGVGYTQSFMIMREKENDFPELIHRCSERVMYAERDWEMPKTFPISCLFSTGAVLFDDELVISYGAADEKAGIARVSLKELETYIRQFDADGKRI